MCPPEEDAGTDLRPGVLRLASCVDGPLRKFYASAGRLEGEGRWRDDARISHGRSSVSSQPPKEPRFWPTRDGKLIADAAKSLSTGAWEKIQALWGKLRGRVEQKPAAVEAAQDVARTPEDPGALATLRLQIKKLLAEDEAFAAEIAHLVGGSFSQANLQRSGAIAQGAGSGIRGEWNQRQPEA